MALNNKKIFAFTGAILLSLVGIGAVSAPAYADACPYPVTPASDQVLNDHPVDRIKLVSPVLTTENSIERTDFETIFTEDCNWFGVGMKFYQVYVPYGTRTTVTFNAATSAGKPLANTEVKLRANKGHSKSNADIRVNGSKAQLAKEDNSEGLRVKSNTDVNGNVSFVISSPTNCGALGTLPSAPASMTDATPHDANEDPTTDCYSQLLPEITGEKTDAADFIELHYYDAASCATTAALGTSGNLVGGDITTTYNNKNAGLGATLKIASSTAWTSTTIDGQPLKPNDVVLIKNQVSRVENGLYVVTSVGSVGDTKDFLFTRDKSNDEPAELDATAPGQYTYVLSGDSNEAQTWSQKTVFTSADSIGVQDVVWQKSSTDNQLDGVTFSVVSPLLNETNSFSPAVEAMRPTLQTYAGVGTKQVLVVQASNADGTWVRNQPLTLHINLANSGANASISAGIIGNASNGLATTLLNTDSTKTTEDQLVLSGVTDGFGLVTFQFNNNDTTGEAQPATPTSPVPARDLKFASLSANLTNGMDDSSVLEVHYYKPVPPITVSAAALGRKIGVTITNAIGKAFTVTITGLKKATVRPTKATQTFLYTVTKGVKTVTVSADGRTLTKKFTIK